MKLSKSLQGSWQIIHVEGQIDSKSVAMLRDFVDTEVEDALSVALDLTSVPFMSSAGLRTLLMLHHRTQEMGVSLALVGIAPEIADTMKITGFYDHFTIHPDPKSLLDSST